MSDARFRDFLDAALAALRRECPPAFSAMAQALGDGATALRVGNEDFVLLSHAGRVETTGRCEATGVEVVTDRATILDLVDARLTLAAAVLDDRLLLRGAVEDLLGFHEALLAFVAGGVRSPSFPALLGEYRGARGTSGGRDHGGAASCRDDHRWQESA